MCVCGVCVWCGVCVVCVCVCVCVCVYVCVTCHKYEFSLNGGEYTFLSCCLALLQSLCNYCSTFSISTFIGA